MRRLILLLLAAVPALAGCAVPSEKDATTAPPPSGGQMASIDARVMIKDTDPTEARFTWDETPPTCSGDGEFADVTAGATVVVRDDEHKVLATSRLQGGLPGGLEEDSLGTTASTCTFTFFAPRVPERMLYQITIGRQPASPIGGAQAHQGQVLITFGG